MDKYKVKIFKITKEEFSLLEVGDESIIEEFNTNYSPLYYKYFQCKKLNEEEQKEIKSYSLTKGCKAFSDEKDCYFIKVRFLFDEAASSNFSKRFSIDGENSTWKITYYPGKTSGPPEDCYPDDWEYEIVSGGLNIKYDNQNAIWLFEELEYIESESQSEEARFGRIESVGYGKEVNCLEDIKTSLDYLNKYFESIEKNGYFIIDKDYTESPSNYKSYLDFITSTAYCNLDGEEESKYLPSYELFCSLEKKL